MRQISYTYPGPDYNAIAATQSWTTATGSYVVINGDLSLAIQRTPGQNADRYAVMPGIQRTIGIFSTGNLSAVVFLASGIDTNGRVVTASFVGPSGGSSTASDAFATFTAEFHQVNYLYATAAATSAFTVGTGATGATRWTTMDGFSTPFNVALTVITTTGVTVNVQDTPNNPNVATSPTVFAHATLQTVVANQQSNYAYPVSFVRATFSATGAGSSAANFILQQAG